VTTIVFIGVLVIFAWRIAEPVINGGYPNTFDLLAGFLLAVLVGYAWLRSVRGYRIGADEVIVERTGPGKLHIALGDVKSAEARPDLGSFIRSNPLGLQGLFGWSGNVEVRKPSDTTSLRALAYGTNPTNTVVMEMANGRTVILTPRDTEGFTAALRQAGVSSPTPEPAPKGQYMQGPRKKKN
jgi:hypothetical protein